MVAGVELNDEILDPDLDHRLIIGGGSLRRAGENSAHRPERRVPGDVDLLVSSAAIFAATSASVGASTR